MKITTHVHLVPKIGMSGATSIHLMRFHEVERYKFTLDERNF